MSDYSKAQIVWQKGVGSSRKPAKGLESAAMLVGPVMAGVADQGWKDAIGRSLMEGLEAASADELEAWFAAIVRVKRNIEDEVNHRSARAVLAFHRYQDEHGRRPSRKELKGYILENPKVFGGDFPPADEDQLWTPIFNAPALKGRFRKPKRGS